MCAAVLLVGAEKKDDLEDTPQLMVYKDQIHFIHGLPFHEMRFFTGVVVSKHENGLREMYVTYKDGKQHGLTTSWDENGRKEESNWKGYRKEGLETKWYGNGQKQENRTFKDGKQNGVYTWWIGNGQKQREGNLKERKQDGLYTYWYENGQKMEEGSYKDGKVISAKVWKPNGKKCPDTNLKDGNGDYVRYNENGT